MQTIKVTPGDILKEDFMEPMGISQYRLAKELGVSAIRISEIVRGHRAITPETGLLMDKFFNLSQGYWFSIQNTYDLLEAKKKIKEKLARVKAMPIHSASSAPPL